MKKIKTRPRQGLFKTISGMFHAWFSCKQILRNPIDSIGDPNDCEKDNDLVVVHLNSCYKLDVVNFSLLKSLTIDCTTAIIKLGQNIYVTLSNSHNI